MLPDGQTAEMFSYLEEIHEAGAMPSKKSTALKRLPDNVFGDVKFDAVPTGDKSSVLKRADEETTPTYLYEGKQQSIQDHLNHSPITGLLIARGDTILFEHYQYGRSDRDRFLSQSLVKTLVGLLVGTAISEDKIRGTSKNRPVAMCIDDR